MLAIVAAVIFGLALLLDWANVHTSDAFTPMNLLLLGMFCLALHFAGVGATTRIRSRRR